MLFSVDKNSTFVFFLVTSIEMYVCVCVKGSAIKAG